MKKILLCFYVHKSIPLSKYRIYEIGEHNNYFSLDNFSDLIQNLAQNSYLPLNNILIKYLNSHPEKFKINIYISDSTIRLFEKYHPEVLDSFKELAEFDSVELITGSSSNPLPFQNSNKHFEKKIISHTELLNKHFQKIPSSLRLDFLSEEFLESIKNLNLNNVILSRNFLPDEISNLLIHNDDINFIVPNKEISDNINHHFSNKEHPNWPYTSKKFINSVLDSLDDLISIDLNYESFGTTHKKEDGIFNFIDSLPEKILNHEELELLNFSDLNNTYLKENKNSNLEDSILNLTNVTQLQQDAYDNLNNLEGYIEEIGNDDLRNDWERLSSIDYFVNMHPKYFDKERYDSHYDAYVNFMNILTDLKERIDRAKLPLAGKPIDYPDDKSNLHELKELITT